MSSPSSLPLKGLCVLDFSRVLAGPWCTMLLADAGATVIKVERPIVGDDTRSWGPPFVQGKDSSRLSTYFLSVNRGKQSIAIDMAHPKGLEICRHLATDWASVLVENFKCGAMSKFGLGYETLASQNPGLVYCSISGYGPDGPFATYPGYDVIAAGMYGLMSITGDEEGPPAKVGVAMTDVLTGTLAQSGILSALYARQDTGRGQKVDVSLMESQLAGLVNIAASSLNAPAGAGPPKRWGTAHESIVPYQAFPCKRDESVNHSTSAAAAPTEFILVGAGNDQQFVQLCCILGVPDVANDERYRSNASRVKHRHSLIQLLEQIFQTKSRDEWVSILKGQGFPMGPLRSVPEAFQCPQAMSRGMVQEIEHPHIGKIWLPRTPISFSGGRRNDSSVTSDGMDTGEESGSGGILPPPMLGEHTKSVLSSLLGMDSDDIEALRDAGVVECWDASSRTIC
ncbi:CoA-transferase family III domain containing protein [Nitzschia inconspicua]|uniref:CoA-transferase family III domain containing protein n=1 Tax=Nitzschia inconspicua TaxID=303405 RepID=A0A9K3LF43_9STRA|nr:CoA-transferase family III domain containing protein [Nitzschia inconspicua]